MNTPIINPSTLSEEQRDAIRKKYADIEQSWLSAPSYPDAQHRFFQLMLMEELFGSEFFKKGE